MANGLNQIASRYQPKANVQVLPTVSTVRLALNVAACDKLPLAIVVADNQQEKTAMERQLASLAWNHEVVGKMTYASGTRSDLKNVHGVRLSKGYLFVTPNEFGTQAEVVAQLSPSASLSDLRSALKMAMESNDPSQMDHRKHIRMGRQQGIHWDTAIPVTDPHSPENQGGSTTAWGNNNQGGPPQQGRSRRPAIWGDNSDQNGSPGNGPPGRRQGRSPLWGVNTDDDAGPPQGPPPGFGRFPGGPGQGGGPPMGPSPGQSGRTALWGGGADQNQNGPPMGRPGRQQSWSNNSNQGPMGPPPNQRGRGNGQSWSNGQSQNQTPPGPPPGGPPGANQNWFAQDD
jgi:hypothetical protein